MPGRAETRGFVEPRSHRRARPRGLSGQRLARHCRGRAEPGGRTGQRRLAGAGLDVFADEPRVPPALFALDHVGAAATYGKRNPRDARGDGQYPGGESRRAFAGRPLLTPSESRRVRRHRRRMAPSAPRQQREELVARALAVAARDLAGLALVAARDRAQQRAVLLHHRVGAARTEAEAHAQRLDQQPTAARARCSASGLSATRLIAWCSRRFALTMASASLRAAACSNSCARSFNLRARTCRSAARSVR